MPTVTHVAPTNQNFSQGDPNHSTSGRILSLALSADPTRIYAGSFCGVWRSDDSGQTFYQLVGPLTDTAGPGIFGGVYARHVYDLAASPNDPDLVLAAARDGQFNTNRDGIYRSLDGGHSWELALPVLTSSSYYGISQVLFAPDDPTLAYAALGYDGVAISQDGGKTWNTMFVGANVWHLAVAPSEGPGIRKVYACGDIPFTPNSNIFFSNDGGNTWKQDNGVSVINQSRANLATFQSGCGGSAVGAFGGQTGLNNTSASQIMAVEPGNPAKVYLATVGGAFGPSYYNNQGVPPDGTEANTTCARLADEGSLWYGDFSNFANTGSAQWMDLPGPPIYSGGGDTPSGNVFVITKQTSSGFQVFFSDMSHVHVSQGFPGNFNSWHRLGGEDISQAHKDGSNSNVSTIHADPHAVVLSPDLEITLQPATGVSSPYNVNSELDQYIGGTIWIANDGGVFFSLDGGQHWKRPDGLETLDPINVAGLYGIGNAPAIYFGCGDNSDFCSLNGGQQWLTPITPCGDCDGWFADEADASRVLELSPRANAGGVKGSVNIVKSGSGSHYPDPSNSGQNNFIVAPRRIKQSDGSVPPYPVSDLVLRGYRPIIRTLPTETPLPDGDYVFIHSADGMTRRVVRTTKLSSIGSLNDWTDTSKVQLIGTILPDDGTGKEPVVQAAGGHADPTFYVADFKGHLFKWIDAAQTWTQIVPGGPPGRASTGCIRFFVDPYQPQIIYLVDPSGILISLDGGNTWQPETNLSNAVSGNGKIITASSSVIYDMVFTRSEPYTHFAFGDAGVFGTVDGFFWTTLWDAIAVPGRPESGFFDPYTNPFDRALYVGFEGRSILRLGALPDPWTNGPPWDDMMTYAAIVD